MLPHVRDLSACAIHDMSHLVCYNEFEVLEIKRHISGNLVLPELRTRRQWKGRLWSLWLPWSRPQVTPGIAPHSECPPPGRGALLLCWWLAAQMVAVLTFGPLERIDWGRPGLLGHLGYDYSKLVVSRCWQRITYFAIWLGSGIL